MDPFQLLANLLNTVASWLASVLAGGLMVLAGQLPLIWPVTASVVALLDATRITPYLVLVAHWFPLWALALAFGCWLVVEATLMVWWLYRIVRLATL